MVYKTLNIKDQITDGENRSNINGKQQIQNVNKTIFFKDILLQDVMDLKIQTFPKVR